mgnify:CR=1 FL=1
MDKDLPVSAWPEWKIIEKIGEGSFGKVYKAQRTERGKSFYSAIKIINIPGSQSELNSIRSETGDDHSVREYFQNLVEECIQEISTMEYFRGNSYIVSVEDFKVMEYLDAIGWEISIRMEYLTSFMDYCAEKQLTEKEVIQLGMDLSKSLEYCGKLKIIHRDIKPENIFVSRFGDFKLGDFGIARELERTMSALSKKGTYSYMAPEMYRGEKYDSRVDIYSLGIVLYKLMNHNRLPFMNLEKQFITYRDKENALNRRMSGEKLIKPADAREEFSRIILKACAFDPAQRYQTPQEFYRDLDDLKNGRNQNLSVSEKQEKKTAPVNAGSQIPQQNFNSSSQVQRQNPMQGQNQVHNSSTLSQNRQTNSGSDAESKVYNRKKASEKYDAVPRKPEKSDSDSYQEKKENGADQERIRQKRNAARRLLRKKRRQQKILVVSLVTAAVLLAGAMYVRSRLKQSGKEISDNLVDILDDDKYSTDKNAQQEFSAAIDQIKERATTITNNLDSYNWIGVEGDILRYMTDDGKYMKALIYPKESGDGVYEEYFYWNEKLFFAYIWYDETKELYYYDNGELIRWIDASETCHDNETDNEEYVKRGKKYWDNSLKALKGEGTKKENGVSN